jgi:hypothetical protein
MSSFQSYEFQAIDHPLTKEAQQAVSRLSSRVSPHPWRACFTYHWSDFPGDPEDILLRYYDMLLYTASWGSRHLAFRFPKTLFDLESAQVYCRPPYVEEFISFSIHGQYLLLNITFRGEEGVRWADVSSSLDTLLPLRDDLLRGDYRALYLAWLKTLEVEDVLDSVTEPPPPPGLSRLTPALRSFIDLFEIDADLIQVAAEESGEMEATPLDDLRQAVAALEPHEKDAYLVRLAQGELGLSLLFNRHLRTWIGETPRQKVEMPRRSVGELLAAAQALRERRRMEQAARMEAQRIAELEALAQRKAQAWRDVDALIQQSNAKAYEQAVDLLARLKELAVHQGDEATFTDRLNTIYTQYHRRSSLLRHLRKAGLIPTPTSSA